MYTIGEFASIGRVSVRMLRHYDEIGLLVPARVDPFSGYRSYSGAQFAELGRLVAVKELGFKLEDVAAIVHGTVSDDGYRALLVERRAELARQIELDIARLGRIEARLRTSEGGTTMSGASQANQDAGRAAVELRALPAVRVALATAVAPGFGPENISPVIGPLFDRLRTALTAAGSPPRGEAFASYEAIEDAPDGESVRASAAFAVDGDVADADADGFSVQQLPAVELAATLVHYGEMARIGDTWQALDEWIDANGYELAGVCRERYVVAQPEPEQNWVTELQQPVVRR
ncbi:MerR family transcriptional regulator [Microterricola viridarii]|uniref:HTH merR-type domain-containing protein n=1 Tax=Microterricola viridarii TaxID=412690 RepID=A0A0Y0MKZ9_9MICO|nr:MerR family transcriptional regulator [Microterricola viridarii]AMB57714.1 hypothetical protein AWU67_01250 [Microterricola viridarii]